MNLTNMNDTDDEQLLKCSVLNNVGIYCVFVMLIALISNIILIWILLNHKKELLKNFNMLILVASILSLIGTIVGFPILSATSFKCRYIFGKIGCWIEAFTFYFVSMTIIFVLTCISFIRYIKATKSNVMKKIKKVELIASTVLSALLSLVITIIIVFADIFPTHISMISCSKKMISFTPVTIGFKVALAVIVFFLPMTLLIFTNARVICFMKKMRKRAAYLNTDEQKKNKIKAELNQSIRLAVLITGFISFYLPCVFSCLYKILIDGSKSNPDLETAFTILAKSSVIWFAFVVLFGEKDFRNKFLCKKTAELSHTTVNSNPIAQN